MISYCKYNNKHVNLARDKMLVLKVKYSFLVQFYKNITKKHEVVTM